MSLTIQGLYDGKLAALAESDFRVVCIGGSAGSLGAYIEILRGLPNDSGMAFVVIPHRAPHNPGQLPAILARATMMPVCTAEDGMQLTPNHVYVVPSRTELTMTGQILHLRTASKSTGWPNTITLFLFSLAKAMGQRSVAVILSGLDSDGAAALEAVKMAGGVTIAQSDASFDDMPQTAIETGHIDQFLPASHIAFALMSLAQRPLSVPS